MSAIQNPRPIEIKAPPPSPAQPPQEQGGGRWKAGIVLLLILMAAGVMLWQRNAKQQAELAAVAPVRTAKVVAGPLVQTIRLAGPTSSMIYTNVTAPVMRGRESGSEMILLELIQSGTRVKKGQVVAAIDGQAAKDHIDDVHDTVTAADADIRKRKAEQEIDLENLMQTVRVAKAEFDKANLDLKGSETRTEIEKELMRLAAEEAEARYKQVSSDIAFKKAAHAAELKILEYTRERHVRHRDRHKMDLERYTMRAAMDGLAVVQMAFRGGEFNVIQMGDQIAPGQLLMKIVEPGKMQVEATVNQVEAEMIRLGQPATIGLDAFPGLKLSGKVYSINAMAVRGWREQNYVRNIPVRVAIHGADPRLIPDLSAYADVQTGREENAKQIPLPAVHSADGKDFVYVKSGPKFAKRDVTLGLRNNTHVAVVGGLEVNEEVALEKPPADLL
jgi:multidrug efflux pump subunit AcrA (membrane-fusion protein)